MRTLRSACVIALALLSLIVFCAATVSLVRSYTQGETIAHQWTDAPGVIAARVLMAQDGVFTVGVERLPFTNGMDDWLGQPPEFIACSVRYYAKARPTTTRAFAFRRPGAKGSIAPVPWSLSVPHWFVMTLALIMPTAWLYRRIRTRIGQREGNCHHCGYDLRATPGRCPECGTESMRNAE